MNKEMNIFLFVVCWSMMVLMGIGHAVNVEDMRVLLSSDKDILLREAHCYSITGEFNNQKYHKWGSAGVVMNRHTPNAYTEGIEGFPRDYVSPREISNVVSAEEVVVENSFNSSDWLWAFGQFIDHDLDFVEIGDEPADIELPPGDSLGDGVIRFTRSVKAEVVRDYMYPPREQKNKITSYADLSNVYGSTYTRTQALRGENGRMKVSENNLLPWNFIVNGDFLFNDSPGLPSSFFIAGDIRANEVVSLTSIHTLFVREHNRIADMINEMKLELGMELCTDEVFYIARMINTWQYQNIIYNEFLPALLGNKAPDPYSLEYKNYIDPSITNEFSTAAFRVGHTLISPTILHIDESGNTEEVLL
eukprot:TRINITY_DN3661_c0_g1_i3.p1 TRINITY_DN3661_c0_g1~~TRINITY_DN3661_c0_g1_i3.p1  ORF type:complete len:362 (-),score=64.17 TRINITY_DN3661_c0_g1_i3:790-1875(-)